MCLFLIFFVLSIQCADISGKLLLPKSECEESPRVFLEGNDGVFLQTFVIRDCTFTITDVPIGIFNLDIEGNYAFPILKLTVKQSSKGHTHQLITRNRVNLTSSKVRKSKGRYIISATGHFQFFPVKKQFNFAGYLKNPMVIMIVMTVFASFVLPKIMNTESMKEAQEEMKKSGGMLGGLGGFFDKLNNAKEGMKKELNEKKSE